MKKPNTTKPVSAHRQAAEQTRVTAKKYQEEHDRIVRRREIDIEKELEPILGERGYGAKDGELKALYQALALNSELGLKVVLQLIAIRGVVEEAVIRYDPVDDEDPARHPPVPEVDDVTLF